MTTASEKAQLQSAGMKVTRPRVMILEILEQASEQGVHVKAEDVYRRLLKFHSDVGIATVYRALTQFVEAGIVKRHNFDQGSAVYELNSGSHHDHMVCLDSGRVIEFVHPEIERLQEIIAELHGFRLIDHSLILYVRPKSD